MALEDPYTPNIVVLTETVWPVHHNRQERQLQALTAGMAPAFYRDKDAGSIAVPNGGAATTPTLFTIPAAYVIAGNIIRVEGVLERNGACAFYMEYSVDGGGAWAALHPSPLNFFHGDTAVKVCYRFQQSPYNNNRIIGDLSSVTTIENNRMINRNHGAAWIGNDFLMRWVFTDGVAVAQDAYWRLCAYVFDSS